MGLTLVTGRANAGKTGVLHGVLREALAEGLPATLLLPTMPDVRRTEAELAREGLVGARIAVLDSWIDELWTLHGDGRRIVTPGARRMLVERAVAETPLRALSASASSPGFAALAADVVQRLTRPAPAMRGSDTEVAAVLHRYDDLAAEAALVERSVAARLLGEDPPAVAGPVLVNRFTDLSEAQEALLRGVARRSDVVLALTWEPDLPATAALDPLVERMFASAEMLPLPAPADDSELGRLEERLYCPGDPIVAGGSLAVGLAAGDEAECVLAARAARRLLDGGVEPDRLAVVFRDAGRRLGLLTASLAAEGIAADLDIAVPVSATPLGAALSSLVGACIAPSRESLLAWLLSPYADAEPDAVAAMDSRWRRYRVGGDRLLRDADGLGRQAGAALAAARQAVRHGLSSDGAGAWRGLASALLASAVQRHAAGSAQRALDAAAHRAVLALVDDVASVPGARLPASAVLEMLSRTEASLGSAERPGAVQVTEAHRLRSRRFDAVILGGLTAEEFSAERPQPLAAELAERMGAAPGMREREAERMLFYLVATRARKHLVLLRQDSDARGEAKRPSVFWDEVVDLYLDPSVDLDEAPSAPPGIEPERLGLAELAHAAPAYAPGRRERRAEVAPGSARGIRRGVLRTDAVLEALAETREFSVTELETYLSCPYRWFFDRSLRLREIDTAVDARERGSRAHAILAAFYAALEPRLGIERVAPERLEDALGLFDDVAGEVEEAASTRPVGLREELTAAQARAWARAIVRDDAEWLPAFRPLRHESAFGEAAGSPFSLGAVSLRGSIDRVDAGPDGIVVVDYKSEKDPAGQGSFASRRLIQLPVYAAAASAMLGSDVIGGLYRSLRSLSARGFRTPAVDVGARGSSRDEVGEDRLAEIVEETSAAVAAAAAGIRAGRIAPEPATRATCAHCGARAFCEEAR